MLVEGAGSPAEINLRKGDIANMGFARAQNVPVVLIGDIDRGGVIAQIVGTKTVLDPQDAAMVRGFLVNKFRGDASLFSDGMAMIAERTGWAALGLVPFFAEAARLPAEDAVALARRRDPTAAAKVVAVPHAAAYQQFRRFRSAEAGAGGRARMVPPGEPLPVVRSGRSCPAPRRPSPISPSCARRAGTSTSLAHVRRGGKVLGICGGYQMLGQTIADPLGMEGPPGAVAGLGLLDVDDRVDRRKDFASAARAPPFRERGFRRL